MSEERDNQAVWRAACVEQFLEFQQDDLISAFNGPELALWTPYAVMAAGFASFTELRSQVGTRDAHYKVTSRWQRLGRRRLTSTQVLIDGMTGAPELWARASYRQYRSAFGEFLGLYELPPRIDDRYDVDHMFARSRMRNVKEGVVRLVLTEQRANRGWGSWLERLEVGWTSGKPRHAARAVQIAKAIGLAPPDTALNPDTDLRSLHLELVDRGLDITLDELAANFEMAHKRASGNATTFHAVDIREFTSRRDE